MKKFLVLSAIFISLSASAQSSSSSSSSACSAPFDPDYSKPITGYAVSNVSMLSRRGPYGNYFMVRGMWAGSNKRMFINFNSCDPMAQTCQELAQQALADTQVSTAYGKQLVFRISGHLTSDSSAPDRIRFGRIYDCELEQYKN